MAVLVDPPMWPAHGRRWSHLVSDSSLAELHAFARAAGIPERGFEGDHYDVPEERYAATVAAGAIPVSSRELLRRLVDSGLRRPKRRGERVPTSRRVGPAGDRLDTLVSALSPTAPVRAVHVVGCSGFDVLVLPDGDGLTLPAAAVDASGPPAASVATDLLGSWLEPPSGAAPGSPAGAAPGSPAGAALGAPAAPARGRTSAGPVPLGYLRLVPARGGVGHAEQVLRWSLPSGLARPVAREPAGWVHGPDAARLMPAELMPLVLRALRADG